MKPEIRKICENTPDDEPRSRLEPYREVILRWRRQGRSYRRICELLGERFGLKIRKSALHQFARARSRPRPLQAELETAEQTGIVAETEREEPAPVFRGERLSPEERARQRALIQAIRQTPAAAPADRKRYCFDPNDVSTIKDCETERKDS